MNILDLIFNHTLFYNFRQWIPRGIRMLDAQWRMPYDFFFFWSNLKLSIDCKIFLNNGVRSQGGGQYDRCVGNNIVYVCDLWGEVGSDPPSHVAPLSLPFFPFFFLKFWFLRGEKYKNKKPYHFFVQFDPIGVEGWGGERRGGRQPIFGFLFLLWYMYLSCMWFGVTPKIDTKTTCVQRRLDCMLKLW